MPTDIISLTEFKNDASGWIERLQSQPPVVLTQNGRGKAVVQSYESYRQQRYAMALLKRVIQGQADAAAGRMVSLEQVKVKVKGVIDAAIAREKEAATAKHSQRAAAPAKRKAVPAGRRRA